MNPTAIIVLAAVASASAGLVGPAVAVGGLSLGLPVAIGGRWHNGPLVNTVAAINSGALAAANVAGVRGATHLANANAASWNDANNLARQISQQSQTSKNHALQSARDQLNAINQLAAISQAQRVNQGSNVAQSTANQAALRQTVSNQNIAALLNAINGGGARDAGIHQAAVIRQVGAVHANAALANSLRWGGWGSPATAVVGLAPAAVIGNVVGTKVLLG